MQYYSFSAFTSAIRQSISTAVSRLPAPTAWLLFLPGGLLFYSVISGPTPIALFGRQADGVVVGIRYTSGVRSDEYPLVRYSLPDGKAVSFQTTALLGRKFTVGEKLHVRYLSWWPERAEIFSFGQLFSPLIIGWIGAYVLLSGGVGLIRARKQRISDQQNLADFIASQSHPK